MPKEDEDIARSGGSSGHMDREQRRAAQAARGEAGEIRKQKPTRPGASGLRVFAQIKKSRRYRNDKAGSSNKEWLYKQMLYSKD
ncbi:hypothetical protein [Aeromonas jandaei]|uniref:hypothetical protein n=1 Tax=Aeromonas jandaei TaxID=650 RepID=UPI001AC006DE|nr:hypothetical protein [Aeromonas jandaei]QSR73279.1 hypothetical protein GP488_12970 [Aeromonas jandaei]